MKLNFEKISLRNFLSYGDTISNNVFYLDTGTTTLVSGANGVGKSSAFLDSLCFALYGKPFRNVKKEQLINSINEKNCEVHLEFSINGLNYKIIRGMKPNKFEIYRNDSLIEQNAGLKEYQAILNDIIKCPYSTFTNLIVMGSASYASFMNLPPSQRREIVSNVLDIDIFNVMSDILSEMNNENKEFINEASSDSALKEQELQISKNALEKIKNRDDVGSLKEMLEDEEKAFKKMYSKIEEANEIIEKETNTLIESFGSDSKLNTFKDDLMKINAKIQTNKSKIKTNQKNINFFENDSCPSCEQTISKEIKETKTTEFNKEINLIEKQNKLISEKEKEVTNKIIEIENITQNISIEKNKIVSLKDNAKSSMKKVKEIKSHIENSEKNKDEEISFAEIKVSDLNKEFKKVEKRLQVLEDKKMCLSIVKLLLKDNGLKTQIIKQWLPSLNFEINKILDELEAPYSFQLDEQFNETIKSRYRDNFSYASFSEGEKSRIDFSILFAFREIAKKKASVDCNILILDEILDGSLDSDGTGIVLKLFAEQDLSIFVVSHKIEASSHFSKTIEIEKKGNFSSIFSQDEPS